MVRREAICCVAILVMGLACGGAAWGGISTHPRFFTTIAGETSLDQKKSDATAGNIFGKSPKSIADAVIAQADAYLANRSFMQSSYHLFHPFLQPFPHDMGSSLHVGTDTSTKAMATWVLPSPVTPGSTSYLVEFEYYYENPAEQENFYVFSSYTTATGYTLIRLMQTGDKLSTNDAADVATLTKGVWHHIAIEVMADRYDLYVNGELKRSSTSFQGGNSSLVALGAVGDIGSSDPTFRGQGWWDNFRVSRGPEIIYSQFINDGLTGWDLISPASTDATIRPHEGMGSSWTGIGTDLKDRMAAVSIAYVLTQDTQYSDWLKPVLTSITDGGWDLDVWADPDDAADVSLFCFHVCRGVAIGYDSIFHQLSAGEQSVIRSGLHSRALDPMKVYSDDWITTTTNYYPNAWATLNAAQGIGALAIRDEVDVSDHLADARAELERLYEEPWFACVDGGWPEGISYGGVCTNDIMEFYYFDQRITDTDNWNKSYLSNVGRFLYHVLTPSGNKFVNFADATADPNVLLTRYHAALAILCCVRNDTYAMNLVPRLGWQADTPLGFMAFRHVQQNEVPSVANESYGRNFRQAGWASLRSSWNSDALMVATHAGLKVGHSHRDENTIVLAKGDTWFAKDYGYHVKTPPAAVNYTYGTPGHNLIAIGDLTDEDSWQDGVQASAGQLTGFYVDRDFGISAGDAAAAYPNLDVSTRRLVMDNAHEYLLVFDEYAKSNGVTAPAHFLIHTERDGSMANSVAVNGRHADVAAGGYNMDMDVLAPANGTLAKRFDTAQPQVAYILVNMKDGYENPDNYKLEVSVTYIADADSVVIQSTPTGGVNIGSVVGSSQWRTDTYEIITPYRDYRTQTTDMNIMVQFNGWLAISTLQVTVKNRVGGQTVATYTTNAGDQDDTSYTVRCPGISFYPTSWDAPETYDGHTVRVKAPSVLLDAQNPDEPDSGRFLVSLCTQALDSTTPYTYFNGGSDHNVIIKGSSGDVSLVRLHAAPGDLGVEFSKPDYICQAGDANDNVEASHNPGVSFHTAGWNTPASDSLFGYTRSSPSAYALFFVGLPSTDDVYKLSIVYKASSSGRFRQYMDTAYKARAEVIGDNSYHTAIFYAVPPYTDMSGLTGTQLRFDINAPITIARFYLERAECSDACDAGGADDDNVDLHSPGISVYPAEWGSPTTVNYYSARVASQANAKFFVNINPSDQDKHYYVEVTYLAAADLTCDQYTNSDYKTLATLKGDGTVRKAVFNLDRDYRDYATNGNALTNVLLRFSGPVTLMDLAVTGDSM